MRVFISQKFRGDVEANTKAAGDHALDVLRAGHMPFVPHTAFSYLQKVKYGDIIALYLSCKEIEKCDEVWSWGEISEGMRFEQDHATGLGVKVRVKG